MTPTAAKSQMINALLSYTKDAAILSNRPFDGASVFFSLAFKTERELKKLCKTFGINIKTA